MFGSQEFDNHFGKSFKY